MRLATGTFRSSLVRLTGVSCAYHGDICTIFGSFFGADYRGKNDQDGRIREFVADVAATMPARTIPIRLTCGVYGDNLEWNWHMRDLLHQ